MSKNKRNISSINIEVSSSNSKPSRNSKRIRLKSSNHAPACDDFTCKGCDVCEIEIVFTTEDGQGVVELSPDKLFQFALEESSKESSQEHGIAKRLFEMALEGFDKLMSKEEQTLKGKEKETPQKVDTKQTRCQYALCRIAFGIYLPIVEQIHKGIKMFKRIIVEDDDYYDAWIGIGRARISLVCI